MIQALRILRDRNDVLALVVILLSIQFFPGKAVPGGIYGLGVVGGAAIALHAIGIVLIYRSNRIINFAQVGVGAVAASLFILLTKFFPLVRLVRTVCPPCIEGASFERGVSVVSPSIYNVNYYVSLVLSLLFVLALGWGVYVFVIKRFANAPRLVLTVATIFLAQFLGFFQAGLPRILTSEDQREFGGFNLGPSRIPFQFEMQIAPARFHAPEVLTVVAFAVAVAGLFVYFRRSSTGVAIRASADNPSRVATLGVNSHSVTVRVWVFAAALSGVAGILQAMNVGASGSTNLSVSNMVRILAVAVIGRMVSLPITALAAIVFGILDQAVLWSFGSVVIVDGILLFLVGGILMLQRYKVSRAEIESASEWRAAREIRPIPTELRPLPSVRKWLRGLSVVGTLVLLGSPWAMSPAQTNLMAVVFIYAIVVMSLLVLTGWAGQISLGQFAFAAIGGYVAAMWKAPFLIVILGAAVVGAITAVIVGLPALKMRGLHLAVTTMAFALTTTAFLLNPRYLGKNLPSTLERPHFLGMNLDDQRVYYYFSLVMLALVVAAIVGIRKSRTARALIAARDNEQAAQSFGINLLRLRLGAFAISGFIAALGGALFAFHQHGVKVQAYSPEQSILMFTIAVIGGLGSVAGPLIGSAYNGGLVIFGATPLITAFATGGLGLLLLLFIPGGLSQFVYGIRDGILRRVASRNRIIVPSLLADVRLTGEVPRAPITAKVRPGGGTVFVPLRYRLGGQWLVSAKANGEGGKDDLHG